jgi:hypothetical protein|tara:strand:- start:605 stop:934 length:330 start_codon:yes stop_codon:yes gene_type:complete
MGINPYQKDYLYTPWGKQLPRWDDSLSEVRHGYFYALMWGYSHNIKLSSGQTLEYYDGDSDWVILIDLDFWKLKIKDKRSGGIISSERIESLERIEYAISYPHRVLHEC